MKNLQIGMAGPVLWRGGGSILQTKPWLEFRRGPAGRCAATNEWTACVRLGRCPYLFAQGTCSNRKMTWPCPLLGWVADKWAQSQKQRPCVTSSRPLLLRILVAIGILPHRPVATVILIRNRRSGITRTRCYYNHYIYHVIVFPWAGGTVSSQFCPHGGQEK
jgi:hypothetical protein